MNLSVDIIRLLVLDRPSKRHIIVGLQCVETKFVDRQADYQYVIERHCQMI
jgi:hypothetical protein